MEEENGDLSPRESEEEEEEEEDFEDEPEGAEWEESGETWALLVASAVARLQDIPDSCSKYKPTMSAIEALQVMFVPHLVCPNA